MRHCPLFVAGSDKVPHAPESGAQVRTPHLASGVRLQPRGLPRRVKPCGGGGSATRTKSRRQQCCQTMIQRLFTRLNSKWLAGGEKMANSWVSHGMEESLRCFAVQVSGSWFDSRIEHSACQHEMCSCFVVQLSNQNLKALIVCCLSNDMSTQVADCLYGEDEIYNSRSIVFRHRRSVQSISGLAEHCSFHNEHQMRANLSC